MKKTLSSFFVLIIFLGVMILPASATDPSEEIQQLKEEVKRLLERIEELEKKQRESEIKTKEAEEKVIEVERKVEKVEKKSLKDRVDLSGEARFRVLSETATTDRGFYGSDQPGKNLKFRNATAFPTRIRLNVHAEVVPDIVDLYARLTMNKRWGTLKEFTLNDPFDRPNSFVSSTGRDVTPRFEQAYMTLKIPSLSTSWYVGRLPGLDGPPSRQARSLFPRIFVDSEIDGSLVRWDAPQTALDDVELLWTKTRLWGEARTSEKVLTLSTYRKKVSDKSGLILGYLKYDERGSSLSDDADVMLAQGQLKIGKETELILSGLYMDDWHMPMPNAPEDVNIPDITTPYYLAGLFADTQLLGFQVYGAFYYSHFKIPGHSWVDDGTTYTFEGEGFPGRIWFAGFNTGDLISPRQQLTVEYAKGSDAWINPFNYRGFRRKGTVLQPANNFFYDRDGTNTVVGFYPFHAGVLDIYYDYYFRHNVRFRLGLLDFRYSKHDRNGEFPILGSSKFQHDWWPYFEINLSF